ncbi:hypothetical protein MRU69_13575 [Kocuria flava]|uniref:hypothetical protein n=1 Tax=Kocuria flava TaxID=446860 RepID=UPI001FF58117|nr:hypothetical protein [Kocuria flava]MCJ8505871.1 hypothetical protein [Kocuria flava]
MNTTPASGDQLPDDPHLAEDIGAAPDTPAEDMAREPLPTGQTNAGQQVSGVREAGRPEHEITGEHQDPAEGGYQPPTSD